jgi:Xaa-Pro aminopeptidase
MSSQVIRGERFGHPVSDAEMERRWAALRASMQKDEIDCFIAFGYDRLLGGYIRYLIDFPVITYPVTVLFHREKDITVIGHGASGEPSLPPFATRENVVPVSTPFMTTLNFTDNYIPELILKEIRRRSYKRIGFVCLNLVPAAIYNYLRSELPGVEFVDVSDMVDRVKAIKSSEEIAMIRKAIHIHDQIAAAMPSLMRVGRYEYEIANDVRKIASDLECEGMSIGLTMMPGPSQYRRVSEGDHLLCLIEVSGPGGMYGELARIWYAGEPTEAMVRGWKAASECQKLIAGMVKPGANPVDLLKKNNEYLTERGYAPEGRLFCHGQGYDMVERPAAVPGETMLIEENMFLAIHPTAVDKDTFAFCCDNYLVTKDGCERLTKTPMELLAL